MSDFTDRGMEARLAPQKGVRFLPIKTGPVKNQKITRLFKTFFQLIGAVIWAWRLLRREKVAAVVGVGGYISVPACVAGFLSQTGFPPRAEMFGGNRQPFSRLSESAGFFRGSSRPNAFSTRPNAFPPATGIRKDAAPARRFPTPRQNTGGLGGQPRGPRNQSSNCPNLSAYPRTGTSSTRPGFRILSPLKPPTK